MFSLPIPTSPSRPGPPLRLGLFLLLALGAASSPVESVECESRASYAERARFIAQAVEGSATLDAEDTLAAAHTVVPIAGSRELYESLGQALLSAARRARAGGALDLASGHLGAARHAFDLAQEHGPPAGKTALLHRATVLLEESLASDSNDPWTEAVALLRTHLRKNPRGPEADWARRILDDPTTYLAADTPAVEVLRVAGEVQAPVAVFKPLEPFPALASKARLQGVVILQVLIDAHGSVAEVEVLKGLPGGVSPAVVAAVETWLFQPATLDGEPVAVYYNLAVGYHPR